jgi:hypothetical protein
MAISSSTPSTGFSAESLSQVVGIDAYAESATQEFALGTIYEPNDGTGRRYRYTKNGAVALGVGKLVQAPAPISNHQEAVGGAGTTGAADQKTLVIGTTVTTALTANQYDRGYVYTNKVTGLGYSYLIKSHTNTTTPTITLEENIRLAVDTTTEFTLTANPYSAVIVAPTTLTAQIVGVPTFAVTAAYYFWLQDRGPCAVLVDTSETLVIGEPVGYPETISVAGAVGIPTITDQIIGKVLSVNVAAEYALIELNL